METATGSATWPASGRGCRTWPSSASTRSGSARGSRRRWRTRATTWPTTATSTPVFGTLAEAEAVIEEAHAEQIRIIIDLVPNHCSSEHPWFVEALAAQPGAAARDLFWFRPGRGPDGDLPPNDWESIFGGPAWTRTSTVDGTPGEWYLHLFASEAAGLQLVEPQGARGVRGHPAVLVRPRRGRRADRLGRAAGEGPGAGRLRRDHRVRPGRAPLHRPGRRARHLPRLARGRRRVPGRPGPDRRDLAARPGAVHPLPATGRDALGVQLPVPGVAPGTPRRCGRSSTARSRCTPGSARRPPGYWPTTT